MVETDPIQIDKIQRKLRHRYMLLVGLNIIAYLTVIAFCIVGCNKIGGYSGNRGSTKAGINMDAVARMGLPVYREFLLFLLLLFASHQQIQRRCQRKHGKI